MALNVFFCMMCKYTNDCFNAPETIRPVVKVETWEAETVR